MCTSFYRHKYTKSAFKPRLHSSQTMENMCNRVFPQRCLWPNLSVFSYQIKTCVSANVTIPHLFRICANVRIKWFFLMHLWRILHLLSFSLAYIWLCSVIINGQGKYYFNVHGFFLSRNTEAWMRLFFFFFCFHMFRKYPFSHNPPIHALGMGSPSDVCLSVKRTSKEFFCY